MNLPMSPSMMATVFDQTAPSWSDQLMNFMGGPNASLGLGMGSAIGNYFGQQAMNNVQEQGYQRALQGTQNSLMSLLGRGDLMGENAGARVVGRDTGGMSMYDRVLAPGTILSGGPGGGAADVPDEEVRLLCGLVGAGWTGAPSGGHPPLHAAPARACALPPPRPGSVPFELLDVAVAH